MMDRFCKFDKRLSYALIGKKREVFPGKRFTAEVDTKLIALRCSGCPNGYNRWTLVCQMEQVLSVYERTYDSQYPVVYLDESPKQLISETHTGFTDSNRKGKGWPISICW